MNQEPNSQDGSVKRASNAWAGRAFVAVLASGCIGFWYWNSDRTPSDPTSSGVSGGPSLQMPRVEPLPIRLSSRSRAVVALPAPPDGLAGFNLLLITLDTTRVDRLGCYGHQGIATPAIDGLARQGVLFSGAVAPAPTTAASHASILTGLHPNRHGVMTNGLYRLDDKVRTLAEVLTDRGYATGAMVSTVILNSRYGLNQGFEVYDDRVDASSATVPADRPERRGDHTTDLAVAWLEQLQADRSFFLWLHLYDPHAPYDAPAPFGAKHRVAAYDGEIAFADSQVARILQALQTQGVAERTLVVLAGDHGEGLGQHDERLHGYLLYESTLAVPLIFSCPGRLDGGLHVEGRVSLVDIVPTVLSLFGIEALPGLDGRDLTDPDSIGRGVLASTFHGLMAHGWAPLYAIYDRSMKYIHGPMPELYDLASDPFETNNLLAAHAARAGALRQRLVEFFGSDLEGARPAQPTEQLSAADLKQLESLGYLLGGAGKSPAGPRPDPKQMLAVKYRVEALTSASSSGQDLDRAIQALRRITQEHPDYEPAFISLAERCQEKGAYAWAEAALEEANRISPDMPHTLMQRAELRELQGDLPGAVAIYRHLLSLYPDHYDAMAALGKLFQGMGQSAEAVEPFQRAFTAAPDDDVARQGLIDALTALGRVEVAIDALARALVKQPELMGVRSDLARLLFADKRYAQAVGTLREGLGLEPDHIQLAVNLALILMSAEDPQWHNPSEAVDLLEGVCRRDPRADYLLALSMAHQAAGDLDNAVATGEKALWAARTARQAGLIGQLEQHLQNLRTLQEQAAGPVTPATQPDDP